MNSQNARYPTLNPNKCRAPHPSSLLLSPSLYAWPCCVALGHTLYPQNLWIRNLVFQSSLRVVAEVSLKIIIKTIRDDPATKLVQSGKFLQGLPQVVGPQVSDSGISSHSITLHSLRPTHCGYKRPLTVSDKNENYAAPITHTPMLERISLSSSSILNAKLVLPIIMNMYLLS